jgi:hypothetical protein
MEEKGVHELTALPPGASVVQSRWVFAYKLHDDGRVARYKARLVAKGFTQRYGVDYEEVWAPAGNLATLRVLLVIAAQDDLDVTQGDVDTAFLNSELEETIYMRQPPCFEDGTDRVWGLRKAIYGLKQGARAGHLKLAKFLNSIGYNPLQADPAVFVYKCKSKWLYTHVDDLIHKAPRGKGAKDMQRVFKTFPGKYFGEAHNPLGISIERDRKARTISIAQPRLVEGALARFGQERSTTRDSPLPERGEIDP